MYLTNILNNVIFDPLEQFLILPISYSISAFSFTNVAFTLIFVLAIVFLSTGYHWYFLRHRYPAIGQFIFQLAKVINEEYIHHHHQPFFPIIYFVFFLILICNFCGLVPYSFTITSVLIVTIALSVILQGSINLTGIYFNKIKFLTLFLPQGTPLIIAPFLVIIELISYFARVLSLAIRLFVNMMAGHTLMKILIGFAWTMFSLGSIWLFYGLFPMIIFLLVTCLEVLISFLQAYIFTVLFSIYINDAINLH